MEREMGGRCPRKGPYVYLWLICVEVVSQHSWDKVPLPKRGSQDPSLAGPWLASFPLLSPWLIPYLNPCWTQVSGRYSIPPLVPTLPSLPGPQWDLELGESCPQVCKGAHSSRDFVHRWGVTQESLGSGGLSRALSR